MTNKNVRELAEMGQRALRGKKKKNVLIKKESHPNNFQYAEVILKNPMPGIRRAEINYFKKKAGKNWLFDCMVTN